MAPVQLPCAVLRCPEEGEDEHWQTHHWKLNWHFGYSSFIQKQKQFIPQLNIIPKPSTR